MYFISNEDAPVEKSDTVQKSKSSLCTNNIKTEPKGISNENNNVEKRVYGRARANLSFSSFYIFCEDFRKQLDYLYANESENYRKDMLNYMWKHLNVRDKHKYYETATKARTMYNLPERQYSSENDHQRNSTINPTILKRSNSTEVINSRSSKVVGKLVKVKFSKSCTAPIITPLNVQDVVDHLKSVRSRQQDEVHDFGKEKLRQDNGEISVHQNNGAEHVQPPLDHRNGQAIDEQRRLSGGGPISSPSTIYPVIHTLSPRPTTSYAASCWQEEHQKKISTSSAGYNNNSSCDNSPEIMLQQYQQQPDYTPYGGIGYGAQPNDGYFNYNASESSWYGSPSSNGEHAQMHAGVPNNACTTHIGDSSGNFLNHGYHQTTSTGAATSTVDSYATNNHPVSQTNIDPMADFLGGHQNINENDKIKEEPIDWLSTIINDEVDHGNRLDGSDGGGCGGSNNNVNGNGKLTVCDLPSKGQESNGRLPNFHQAFGSTEIGRFSQHEYYEPPKDAAISDCQSTGQQGSIVLPRTGPAPPENHPSMTSFEPPRQQNRRGRTQRGQHRRNKQTRTAVAAAAAAAAAAAQQYVGYDVTGLAVVGGGRHQAPPYHQDPYSRNHRAQRYHQEYHHHHQQPSSSSSYQNHQQEYYRPYDRMHYQQPSAPPPQSSNQYYTNREQSYAGGYNRFHSCCSTEHIARPSHHNYGPGQYYGDYNTYNQW